MRAPLCTSLLPVGYPLEKRLSIGRTAVVHTWENDATIGRVVSLSPRNEDIENGIEDDENGSLEGIMAVETEKHNRTYLIERCGGCRIQNEEHHTRDNQNEQQNRNEEGEEKNSEDAAHLHG